ncbi:MAG: sigma-70 family RNA polymerase sigma factor [Planctomycetota bacterium]
MTNAGIERLERTYRAPLLDFCQRYLGDEHEAEEVVQEILLAASREVAELRHARAWLYRAARNRCVSRMRERYRRDAGSMPPASQVKDSVRRPISHLVSQERRSRLAEAVDRLPPRYRQVVEMRYLEGMHRAEIAAVLDVDVSTVKWRLSEALKRLRQLSSLGDSSIAGRGSA